MAPTGYFRHALGPPRPALSGAPGWYFADGELAMPVGDLLRWDISMMNQTLLSHASYTEMESPTRLRDGQYSNYALGGVAGALHGHRMLSHSGDVGGFVADKAVFPDDSIAVGVLTNQEASGAASAIRLALASLLIPPSTSAAPPAAAAQAEQLARTTLAGLQCGTIDRAHFTSNANFYFDSTALADYKTFRRHRACS